MLHENQILVVGGAIDGKTVKLTHSVSLELPELQADLEEADQGIILHMKHALDTENRRHGLIIAADTDVAVIAVSCFSSLDQCELFQSINTRLVPLHVICNQIDDQKAFCIGCFPLFYRMRYHQLLVLSKKQKDLLGTSMMFEYSIK